MSRLDATEQAEAIHELREAVHRMQDIRQRYETSAGFPVTNTDAWDALQGANGRILKWATLAYGR